MTVVNVAYLMATNTLANQIALASAASGISEKQLSAIPEWVRVKEACAYSRISKPKLYQLLNAGKIKSVSLRERGQIRGTRLISFDSLRSFLNGLATGGEEQTNQAK
jgi:excisionase family DNA binding protein